MPCAGVGETREPYLLAGSAVSQARPSRVPLESQATGLGLSAPQEATLPVSLASARLTHGCHSSHPFPGCARTVLPEVQPVDKDFPGFGVGASLVGRVHLQARTLTGGPLSKCTCSSHLDGRPSPEPLLGICATYPGLLVGTGRLEVEGWGFMRPSYWRIPAEWHVSGIGFPGCRPCDENSSTCHFFRRISENTDREVGEMGQEGEEVKEECDW